MIHVAADGAGNTWVVELGPRRQKLGPVWFLCHDAPVLVYQSTDLSTFVEDWLCYESVPHDGPLADVVSSAVRRVSSQKIDVPSDALVNSSDSLLLEFARSPPLGLFVRDLRDARTGDGMPVGRFGPRTPLARAGDSHVFAYGTRMAWQRFRTFVTGN